jgi:methylated-DNA-[protein]-cysteine S-methyltransferase
MDTDQAPESLSIATVEDSPVGPLTLMASAYGLSSVRFGPHAPTGRSPGDSYLRDAVLGQARDLLLRYFQGEVVNFDALRLDLSRLTPFQRAAMHELRTVESGQLITYGDLAREIGCRSARAVGQAVGANPLPIVIPCHRVVAGDGRLGGFSGGLLRKVTLLELEGFRIEGTAFGARIERDTVAAAASDGLSGLEDHLYG